VVAASPPPTSATGAGASDRYLAGVSSAGTSVTIWNLTDHDTPPIKWSEPGQAISSISWDRQDNLWVVLRNSSIFMLSAVTGKATSASFNGLGTGTLISLSVAPDGVRVALIVQSASGAQQVEMTGIDRGSCDVNCGRRESLAGQLQLVQGPLALGGPDIADAISLAWYNQDNLCVLDQSGSTSDLYEVPVTGGSPSGAYPVSASGPTPSSAYPESIAAGNTANVLVAGMSNGQLMITTGLGEVWQPLGPGVAPAYSVSPDV
jgi:hypothetical protein